MGSYLLRRLVQIVPTVVGVSVAIFVLVRVLPGDPAGLLFTPGTTVSEEALAQIRHDMGLDLPMWEQYLVYVGRAVHGDLGRSYQTNTPVAEQITKSAPATLELAMAALFVAVVVGVSAGVLAAVKQHSLVDYGTILGASIGMSAPVFWTGLLLILLFAVDLQWLPVAGRLDTRTRFVPVTQFYVLEALIRGDFAAFGEALRHMLMPSLTLGFSGAALVARMTRACMLDVIHQEYMTTARAKGLVERAVLLRHALRNALIPVVTIIGLQLAYLLSGAVLTEAVFNWPGLGTLLVSRVFARDYPAVQGVVLVVSVSFVLVNLLIDALYAYLDPRVRLA